jgi:hypothetical protein
MEQARMWQPAQPLASESRLAYLLAAYAIAMLAIAGAVQLAAKRWHSRRLRVALLLVSAAGLGLVGFGAVRLIEVDLPAISPSMREGIEVGPMHRWLATGVLIVMACVSWTYVLVRRTRSSHPVAAIPLAHAWPGRVVAPLLVLVSYSLFCAYFIYEAITDDALGSFTWSDPLWALAYTEYYPAIAVWIAAMVQLYRAWRDRKTPPAVQLHGLPRGQFLTLLLLNVALAVVGGFVAAWLAFALWLTPWYRWGG